EKGVKYDTELDADDLKKLAGMFKELYRENVGSPFPQDTKEQLMGAVKAVFRSWNNSRAIVYRRMNDIPGDWGTAVTVMSMVFGNMGDDSGTGVAFSRNPATGEKKLFGEFLINAQGEDVVAGIRTPQTIDSLQRVMPEVYAQFADIAEKLEKHYRDMQDMEFTIERGRLYMLQTRNGKRTARAAVKIAADLVKEGLCTREEALLKIDPKSLDSLLHPRFDEQALKKAEPLTTGLAASPGAASGAIYFTAEDAAKHAADGPVLLVRLETSPEDIEGMKAARGILTVRGGMTSHAAVVARQMGVCCVSGCGEISFGEDGKHISIKGRRINEGEVLSIDGVGGGVYLGALPTAEAEVSGDFAEVMAWADELRALEVRTNADTPADAAVALRFGAQGIGLTRTEHMFFNADRIPAVREMIVSKTVEQRRAALDKLLGMQRGDFEGIYRVMQGRPVTIRLLDPPLHEFLPTQDAEIAALAEDMGISAEELRQTVRALHEVNPMMGHRGCRLSVTYPEIAEMQTRAIIEAAVNVSRETGIDITPEIMIPLVCELKELKYVKSIIVRTAEKVLEEKGAKLHYKIGTMIEIPRAALTADEIASEAEFFSFGTNDLTQMTFGFSRDDAAKFLPEYYSKKILESDPFARLDRSGVGKLVKMAAELGRSVRPDIKLGICGEHGG
ncbi:MAG: pyruvate, phosphate dikinase, partial [Oscillospiraceae bacterium]|nr:pyruvate, phosphate dikinase [Oscillospiraceae bacterium]